MFLAIASMANNCKIGECQKNSRQSDSLSLIHIYVRVWDKVRYGSEDVEATANAKTVSVTDADMLTYILFDLSLIHIFLPISKIKRSASASLQIPLTI